MNSQKKKIIFITIFVITLIICVTQGVIIYNLFGKSPESKSFHSIDKFSSFLDKKFKNEKDQKWDLYDRFFNDDFFSKNIDPFKEMEEFQKRIEDMMGKNNRQFFKDSWKGWFNDRFIDENNEIQINTTEKNNAYLITIKIPNMKNNKLNIEIEKNGIFIDGEFSQTIERKDSKGNIIGKHELHQSISKTLPIPSDADYKNAKVKNKKEEIIIEIPKI